MRVPTEYRVRLDRDEWYAEPVTGDADFRFLEGFGTSPIEALEDLGNRVSMVVYRRLDEIRKNAEEAKR